MPKGLYKVWGKNIALYRTAKSIPRERMAEDLGVSLATMSRWENGVVAPRDDLKLLIAEYLELPAVTLFPLIEVPS